MQRLQIESAANTLCINARDAFFRAVAKALETAPQPITTNDVLWTVKMALDLVRPSDKLCSQSLGAYQTTNTNPIRRRL